MRRCRRCFAQERIRREDVFVTTKVWNNNHRPERVRPASSRRAADDSGSTTSIKATSSTLPLPSNRATSRTRGTSMARCSTIPACDLIETWRGLENLVDAGRQARSACPTSISRCSRRSSTRRTHKARGRRGRIPSVGLCPNGNCLDYCHSKAWDRVTGLRGAGARDGAPGCSTIREDRRHRAAPWENPGPGGARLGDTARHRAAHDLGHAQPHPGETSSSRPCRRTPCRTSEPRSGQACGSTRWWKRACPVSIPLGR